VKYNKEIKELESFENYFVKRGYVYSGTVENSEEYFNQNFGFQDTVLTNWIKHN